MVSVPRVSLSQGVSLQCTENFSSINTCEQLLREREREAERGGRRDRGRGSGARGSEREKVRGVYIHTRETRK